MSLNKVHGWYADRRAPEAGARAMWQPCLQNDFSGIVELDMWFDDRETCEWFIRKHLVGQGWVDGPRRHPCPDCEAAADAFCVNLTTGEKRLTFHSERLRYLHGGWPS